MNTLDTKLFVFSRKEVALIFLIVLSLSITSFALGVKFGKRYYLQLAGIQATDVQEVELKSVEEEKVSGLTAETDGDVDTNELPKEDNKDLMHEQLKEQIINELNQQGKPKVDTSSVDSSADIISNSPTNVGDDNPKTGTNNKPFFNAGSEQTNTKLKTKKEILDGVDDNLSTQDSYSGKYTIQLGSHRSLKEAKDFANGFKIRGYSPIVNEVQLKNTGVWFRVSLGVFDTVSEAKEYVIEESSLFEGQDYLFVQFD